MTVNEIITKLQKMISNGEITGNERFGRFKWADDYGEYFGEAEGIYIEEKWKDWEDHGNVVYID
jgi:hypothetical protein